MTDVSDAAQFEADGPHSPPESGDARTKDDLVLGLSRPSCLDEVVIPHDVTEGVDEWARESLFHAGQCDPSIGVQQPAIAIELRPRWLQVCAISKSKQARANVAIVGRKPKPVLEIVAGGHRVGVRADQEQARQPEATQVSDLVALFGPPKHRHGRTTMPRAFLVFEQRDVCEGPVDTSYMLDQLHLRTVS